MPFCFASKEIGREVGGVFLVSLSRHWETFGMHSLADEIIHRMCRPLPCLLFNSDFSCRWLRLRCTTTSLRVFNNLQRHFNFLADGTRCAARNVHFASVLFVWWISALLWHYSKPNHAVSDCILSIVSSMICTSDIFFVPDFRLADTLTSDKKINITDNWTGKTNAPNTTWRDSIDKRNTAVRDTHTLPYNS